ncbi:cytochrome c biogenesis protein DipZ [Leucobacter luti]|uniref:cytochrome c biogenesis protein DipZ n=1 Tax=Leucobacter luti TaxID=340320 RepID=UPI00104C9D82|nr:cytochrome c biogenesis protein DipZ [Leucobacter luti]MCW2288670.1 cytochrome c biogenesis protein CcdA/thiol-disulfide isomerase/thioredoxin [Leucobacter luti]QYM75407.1 cytochrome c biogenesis protein DipZ [Leucobacter luti]TCK45175.1 cytochrome c biogenesis protein CcdA [Leucobacter luti]
MDIVLIGLLGGLITGISPCILPVLPVIFLTAGAQPTAPGKAPEVIHARRSRPYWIIAGLVLSFSVVTLLGSLLLGLLSIPQSTIRWAGVAVLAIIGVGMLFPGFEQLLEKPFQRLPRRKVGDGGNGFGMGLALGTVFVPCAGPVLAAIIVAGATGAIGIDTVLLTVSFALGVAVPLLIFALAGRSVAQRIRGFRKRERTIRIVGGIALIALAIGLAFNVPQALQRLLPDYTSGLQQDLAESDAGRSALSLGGLITDENRDLDKCANDAPELNSCGTAPELSGIEAWLNTPENSAIDLQQLRGKVVLIDFWAYSCINCQRSIPHVVAWDQAYRDAGLAVIGVHSPEYAFEKERSNVESGIADFGIEYPVALDNDLSTWTNYRNRYWPAHYLIDASGTVRHISFGEGNYDTTEKLIRELLADAHPGVKLPAKTGTTDATPELGSTTPETFLGSSKDRNFAGPGDYRAGSRKFTFPEDQSKDTFALSGAWTVETQFATPGDDAQADAAIRLTYRGQEVRTVVAGSGTIEVAVSGGGTRTIDVGGTPRSVRLVESSDPAAGTLDLTVTPGVQVYSFTFG